MARGTSAAELREHRDVLVAFERDYREYVDAQRRIAAGQSVNVAWIRERRSDLLRRAARAERARAMSGYNFAITPPPLLGGPVLHSLAQQIFAHETSLFGGGDDPFMTTDMTLDALGTAIGALDDRVAQAEREEAARRASPVSRAADSAGRHLPTLWGRLRHVPTWVGFVADLITVGTVLLGLVAGALKLAGVI